MTLEMEAILLTDKANLGIKAKQINSSEKLKTLTMLLLSFLLIILLANLKFLILLLPRFFEFAYFLSDKYVMLAVSLVAFAVCLPVLSRLKTTRELWFIFKIKSQSDLEYKAVRKAVKRAGFRRYFMLYIKLWALNIFWFCALLIPSAVLLSYWTSQLEQANATLEVALIMVAGNALFLLIALVSFFCIRQRYTLCYWLIIERDDLSSKQIIKESARIMDKRCVDLFLFKLRFAAWITLSLFIWPFCIYSYPYFKQSCAVYALDVLATRNRCEDATISFDSLK